MGICLSCCLSDKDSDINAEEQTGLLQADSLHPNPISLQRNHIPDPAQQQREQEELARIVARTSENLIDIYAVNALERTQSIASSERTSSYSKRLACNLMPISSESEIKSLSSDQVSYEEREFMKQISRKVKDALGSIKIKEELVGSVIATENWS